MQDFRRLKVWQRAHRLTLEIYRSTSRFPVDERFGIKAQLQRAAASIGANIAEGCGRQTDRELVGFLQIAMGSASEVEYELLLARDLDLLDASTHAVLDRLTIEVKRMLASLLVALRKRETRQGRGAEKK
ncbi:MAG TPA: four helix bundle protein [Gemmatimonadaceae bacterium]